MGGEARPGHARPGSDATESGGNTSLWMPWMAKICETATQ